MVADLIGQTRANATTILRTHGLTPLRGILSPDCFGRAFPVSSPPHAVLVPEVVFWLMAMAAMGDGSMTGAVWSFWSSLRAVLPNLPLKPITEEAFCTARGLLPLRFFLRLYADVVERFSQQFDKALRWQGRRLMAIDGSDVELPRHPALGRIYPPATNQHGSRGCPQARLVGLVGLWSGLCHAFRWTSLAVGEQSSARQLLRYLLPLDLLLCDRNFPDLATFAGTLARGADFLFHLPSNRFLKKARTPTPSGRADEWYILLSLPQELIRQFPMLGQVLKVRVLQYQLPGFRPSWLITSLLDVTQFPYEELVALYHERWRHETFHREWKHTLHLSNLRSHSATGLLKEVLVQLTINNVVRWLMAEAALPQQRPVDLKFLQTKRLALAAVASMTAAPVGLLPDLYRQLLAAIRKERILVRPGRAYPRRWDTRGRPKGHGKVVSLIRLPLPQEKSNASI